MNDVIAPKESSLIPDLVESTMFLKVNMSLIHYDQANVLESLIWNTLIPSCPELPNDIGNFDDNEKENDDDDDFEEEDLSPIPIESEEANYMC